MVLLPFSHFLADGSKPFEIMPASEWVSFGSQGYIVCAIYQGAEVHVNFGDYLPPGKREEAESKGYLKDGNKGKIVALLVLGGPDSPHKAGDVGWWKPTTPRGTMASTHRVLGRFMFPQPITPKAAYQLRGGFMTVSDEDQIHLVGCLARLFHSDQGRFIMNGEEHIPSNVLGLPPITSPLEVVIAGANDLVPGQVTAN